MEPGKTTVQSASGKPWGESSEKSTPWMPSGCRSFKAFSKIPKFRVSQGTKLAGSWGGKCGREAVSHGVLTSSSGTKAADATRLQDKQDWFRKDYQKRMIVPKFPHPGNNSQKFSLRTEEVSAPCGLLHKLREFKFSSSAPRIPRAGPQPLRKEGEIDKEGASQQSFEATTQHTACF